jgi:hypothetical protein
LEHGQCVDQRVDFGDELHRRSTGADHRDPLAGQVVIVIPMQGVELGAGEILDSR